MASRNLDTTDDQVNNYEDTNTLINTLWVNSILFCFLIVLFEINRHIKPIYLKRRNKKFIQSGRVPEEPPKYPFGWIVAISRVNDDEFIRTVGLDGYILLRYTIVCFRFSVFIAFWGLIVLTPLYQQAGDNVGWTEYTLANVPDDPNAYSLWAPAIFAYIFSIYFCFALYSEYKNFVHRRIDYLINGDLDTPPQTYYTILIEKIPASLRSEPRLRAFFEKLFPGEVFSVEIALDLGELDDLADKRHDIRDKLEKAIAIWNATGKRPTTWVSYHDKIIKTKEYQARCHHIRKSDIAGMCGYVVVDSIDYHELYLSHLNDMVAQLQGEYFQQQRNHMMNLENHHNNQVQGRVEVHTRKAMDNISQKLSSSPGIFKSMASVFKSDRHHDDMDGSQSKQDSLLDNDSLGQMNNAIIMQVNSPLQTDEMRAEDMASSISSTSAILDDDMISSDNDKKGSGNSNVLDKIRTAAGTGVEGLAKEGYKTAQYATKGALRGVLEATRAFELLTVGAYYSTSSTGFITLNSRVATNCSSQMLLSQKFFQLQVKSAPNPKDIIWDNVSIPQQQINIRHRIADNTLIVGALFWSFVVGFITTIANLDSLSQQYTWLQVYSNTEFYKLLNSYLAVGLLLILLGLLPLIFDIIARNYEGLKLESEIQNSIMSRYFYYQLANVFVSVGLGSLASSIHQIIEQPSSFLSIIGNSLPNLSIYFTNLVIVRTLTAVPIEMLRIWPLIQVLSVTSCLDKKKCTRRELQTGAFADPPMLYGWIYPSIMMVLMIMVTYSCISPLIVPFCVLFFGFVFLMYKYQLLYVYITDYQSGGYMWYAVFTRSLVCLFFGNVTLICYLGIRQTFYTGPFYLLLPLPFMIIGFMMHCNAKFKIPSEKLSLESSIDLDEATNRRRAAGKRTANDTFKVTMFRQPALAEGPVAPMPYRKPRQNSDDGPSSPMPSFGDREDRTRWDFMEAGLDSLQSSPNPPVHHSKAHHNSAYDDKQHMMKPMTTSSSSAIIPATSTSSSVAAHPTIKAMDRKSILLGSRHESFIEDYIDHFDELAEVEHEKNDEEDVEINDLLSLPPAEKITPSKSGKSGTFLSFNVSSSQSSTSPMAAMSSEHISTAAMAPQPPYQHQPEKKKREEHSPIVEVGETSNLLI